MMGTIGKEAARLEHHSISKKNYFQTRRLFPPITFKKPVILNGADE
jgi:hypothetical protein